MAAEHRLEMDAVTAASQTRENITIIGTGNYGISLGKRLLLFGYHVTYGSRTPNKAYLNDCFQHLAEKGQYDVTTIENAWATSQDIIILAVQAHDYVYEDLVSMIVQSIAMKNEAESSSKIVVEISNQTPGQNLMVKSAKTKCSNAEALQGLFAEKLAEYQLNNYKINVVKAFNLINAYALSSLVDNHQLSFYDKSDLVANASLIVPVCGDDAAAKETVLNLCRRIALTAYDIGRLKNSALRLELSNKHAFDNWFLPSVLSILFLVFNFAWTFINYYVFSKKATTFNKYLADFSILSHLNKMLGYTSLQLLAFVYFANIVASLYQLNYSTKYKRFPRLLDAWLRTRKQYGLWAYLYACAHLVASLCIVNTNYLKSWFKSLTEHMTLHGELNLLTGILAFILMTLVALTSFNSIGHSLNWNEWRFVQTKLGLACLATGTLHSFIMYLRIYFERNEQNYSWSYLITRAKLIAVYFPLTVLVLRFLFSYFKPISKKLKKIRQG